jgi:hypothetical protein
MKKLFVAAALAASALASVPAGAAVIICEGQTCAPTDENVLINSGTSSTVTGSTQNTGVALSFTGTPSPLTGDANGQARVTGAGGLLTSLVFTLADMATFTSAEFNLFAQQGNQANEATSVTITYNGGLSTTFALGSDNGLNTNGQNFFGVVATGGDRINSLAFNFGPDTNGVPSAIEDIRQIRLGGVASAVPEPTTWAMMLVGFGAVGYSMRKRPARKLQAI